MKTLGLLGGMSWESTIPYYRLINQTIREIKGGLSSAPIILHSFDFKGIEQMQARGQWLELGELLAKAAEGLQHAGAEGLVICTNTMHRLVDQIEDRVEIPVLHIADATAERITGNGFSRPGLLGTRYTMEQEFYRGRLEKQHGFSVLTPDQAGREEVHRVIYHELCRGETKPDSRARYVEIISELQSRGADCVSLGCTEISLLIGPEDSPLPTFDTTEIHARYAGHWAAKSAIQ